jgi:hypothetical protein
MKRTTIGIRVALLAALCGCMDLDLLDEMIPLDDGGEASTDGAGEGDVDADADGDGPPATDADDVTAPAFVEPACEASEVAVAGACASVGPGTAALRLATDEAAALEVTAPAGSRAEVLSAPWSTEHLIVVAGLTAATEVELQVSAADINGNTAQSSCAVLALDGPPVSITEVLADPLGEEPAQEFVEIANYGDAAVDISGWMIDDGGDCNGDALPAGTVLEPGAVALLVGSEFDAASTADPPPAEGALVVAVEGSLGTSGLTNSAVETIELYDAYGALVSVYDGRLGDPVEGASPSRIRAEAPDGCPSAFGTAPGKPSTPGTVRFVPHSS